MGDSRKIHTYSIPEMEFLGQGGALNWKSKGLRVPPIGIPRALCEGGEGSRGDKCK